MAKNKYSKGSFVTLKRQSRTNRDAFFLSRAEFKQICKIEDISKAPINSHNIKYDCLLYLYLESFI